MSDVFFAAKDSATGFTNLEPSIGGQWLELLKEVAPGVTRALIILQSGLRQRPWIHKLTPRSDCR
jgi:hypothetical protein